MIPPATRPPFHAPYVGITGVVTREDVDAVCRVDHGSPVSHRRIMVGILVSAKALRGETTANRRYTPVAKVCHRTNLAHAYDLFPVIHYNTRTVETLREELDALWEVAGEARGLQLNVVRPNREALDVWSAQHPDVEIILQVNASSLTCNPTTPTPAEALRYIGSYEGLVDHALLDLSGGTGRGVNIAWCAEVLSGWRWGTIRPGIAGGLGPDSGATLRALREAVGAEAFRAVSVDAESGVRVPVDDPIAGEHGQDRLDAGKVAAYVAAVRGVDGG